MEIESFPSICEPPLSEWRNLAEKNRKRCEDNSARFIGIDSFDIKRAILNAAHTYTHHLSAVASAKGISGLATVKVDSLNQLDNFTGRDLPPILLSGHQPVIFHCGVIEKIILLGRAAAECQAITINVLIDTDEGRGGLFDCPQGREERVSIIQGDVARGGALFFTQQVKDSTEINNLTTSIGAGINSIEVKSRLEKALDVYSKLFGIDIVSSNSIVRRIIAPESACLEVPLSHLLKLDLLRDAFAKLMISPLRWVEAYNALLDKFRLARGIKNRANPFPNLVIDGDRVETPFWRVDLTQGKRSSLFLKSDEQLPAQTTQSDELIVPKAALITLFLRLFASDLFVHGTGGAKYDNFTDQFIAEFYKVPAPAFVTVSADRYLFKEERNQFESFKEAQEKRRDMIYHPVRYLDRGIFDKGLEGELRKLIADKESYIKKIIDGKKEKVSTALPTQEVKKIELRIKEIVEKVLGKETPTPAHYNKKFEDTIYYREFPFFLFYGGGKK